MKPLVLDTSAYSRFRAGPPEALRHVESAVFLVVPVILVGEFEMAFDMGSRTERNRRSLLDFLAQDFVTVRNVDQEIARLYGKLMSDQRRRGTPIPVNDVWIAATTLASQGRLLTFDHDFEKIPGLEDALSLLA